MLSKVGIMSCAHAAWIASSYTMGKALADAVGNGANSRVHTPVDFSGFSACLREAEYLIIHTHGSAEGLYDFRADGKGGTLATLSQLAALPKIPTLRLVIITACEAAGGDIQHNVASVLSSRIADEGLVIANRHVVWGADYDFGEKNGLCGWVAYRDGRLLLDENAFPPNITMADAYRCFCDQSH